MGFATKISFFNRERKWKIFNQIIQFDKETKVLDVGFNNKEYSSVDNYLEKKYPYLDKITALGIGRSDKFKKKYPKVKVVEYDGTTFPFKDKEFHVCWSNAVIEHVGDLNKQKKFLREIKRVAKVVFITTPNKYFPIEVHTRMPFLHYLPKCIFDKILVLFNKKWATVEYMNLLSKNDLKRMLKDVGINKYTIISNKILFWTLDYIIIFNDYEN